MRNRSTGRIRLVFADDPEVCSRPSSLAIFTVAPKRICSWSSGGGTICAVALREAQYRISREGAEAKPARSFDFCPAAYAVRAATELGIDLRSTLGRHIIGMLGNRPIGNLLNGFSI
jgi:hypothetical protein